MAWNTTVPPTTPQPMGGNVAPSGGVGAGQRAISVSEALRWAKGALEAVTLTVEGEVSQFKDSPAYKAIYFPLADGASVMDCQMWRNRYAAQGIELKPGMRVRLTGRFSVYAAKGRMSFEVFSIQPAGEGDLRMKVARLARQLEAEGLMDPTRRRPIPRVCERVVVITSPHGKVKDDVARTLRRRNPMVQLMYCPVMVEGEQAVPQMLKALQVAASARPDAILLVRGGGSYEDLMPFNDESLARAVAACPIPVITGIGHEPDTTIADMVSDRRASTPTAAAESVAPDASELLSELATMGMRMGRALQGDLVRRDHALRMLAGRPCMADPASVIVGERSRDLDLASDRLRGAIPAGMAARHNEVRTQSVRLGAWGASFGARPEAEHASQRQRVVRLGTTLLDRPEALLASAAAHLEALSPLKVLERGYSMAYDEAGDVLTDITGVSRGQRIRVRMRSGELGCTVDSIEPKEG